MNSKKFSKALGEIDDKYIGEAIIYQKKRKSKAWVKWASIAACLAIVISSVLIYNSSNTTDFDPNPAVIVESAADFEGMGIVMDIPPNAIDPTYSILDGIVAQINFSLDGNKFTLNASKIKSGVELHGMAGDFDDVTTSTVIENENYSISIDVAMLEGNEGAFATSSIKVVNGETLYISLSTTSQIDYDTMLSIISDVSKSSKN